MRNGKRREWYRYLRSALLAEESYLQRPQRMTCVVLRDQGGCCRGEEVIGSKVKGGGKGKAHCSTTSYWLLLSKKGATKSSTWRSTEVAWSTLYFTRIMLAIMWRKDGRDVKKKAEWTVRRIATLLVKDGILDQGDRSVSDAK